MFNCCLLHTRMGEKYYMGYATYIVRNLKMNATCYMKSVVTNDSEYIFRYDFVLRTVSDKIN